MSDTVQDIITDALREILVIGSTQAPTANDSNVGLRVLNRELDAWAARKAYVYAETFNSYTLAPNHQPHLIGPGLAAPDFAATQRPVRIRGAALILNNVTPNVDVPLRIRDADWWNFQRVKAIATTTPTDLYYEPDWPNGSLFLWPVPTFAYGLRLQLWTLINQFVNLTDSFTFPPGWKKALTLTLAEKLCRPFSRGAQEDLVEDARRARVEIQMNNIKSPRIPSADAGSSGSRGGRRPTFNYYSGQ